MIGYRTHASSEEESQELVSRLHGAASMMGMKINGKKTEVMNSDGQKLTKKLLTNSLTTFFKLDH